MALYEIQTELLFVSSRSATDDRTLRSNTQLVAIVLQPLKILDQSEDTL